MTGNVTIAAARTRARYVGHPADAAAVKSRLGELLAGPVATRLVQLTADLPGEAVICVPDVVVRLRLTRAELDRADVAERWAAAISAAVTYNGRDGPAIWRFADRRAFHASYVRHRLGLFPVPPGVFADFGALDLVTPLRAMAEMLAADPGLWAALADGGADAALELVRAALAQAGEAGIAMVLDTASGVQDAAVAGDMQSLLRQALAQLGPALALVPNMPANLWAALPTQAQCLLATLVFSPVAPANPVQLAGLFVTLLALIRQSGLVPAQALPRALAQLPFHHGSALPNCAVLAGMAAQAPEFSAAVAAVLPDVARHVNGGSDLGAVAGTDELVKGSGGKRAQATRTAATIRHFAAPFAGAALVLAHLAEDGIGAAFPASLRLAALATLVRCPLFPAPEDSDFLQALTGTDDRAEPPARPHARDLLFIPAARHPDILQADPGAPRLAVWLAARFAATLPGLGGATLAFLQRQFFHVPGEVWIDDTHVMLRLDPMPLLAVLELAGRCGTDLARLDWLGRKRLTIRCERGMR